MGALGVIDLPEELIRVEDPHHPDAISRSETGAVLLAPPESGSWRREYVAHADEIIGQEGATAVGAERWHDAGVRGQGIKVAVLDLQWFAAEDVLNAERHDCWAHASCGVSFDSYETPTNWSSGAHGVACSEIVESIAPDAELHLVRVVSYTSMESAVSWAIENDIDILSVSLSFIGETFYNGTGRFHRLMGRAVAAGILPVVSSGNYAQTTWVGRYVDADGDGRMDFDGSNKLPVELASFGSRASLVSWDEFTSCGKSDLDVRVLYGTEIVGGSSDEQDPGGEQCSPVERFAPFVAERGTYDLEVLGARVLGSPLVRVQLFGGRIPSTDGNGSAGDPASSAFSLSVGAAPAATYLEPGVEPFSSWSTLIAGRTIPDVVGPDRISLTAGSAGGFAGTSASAPAVAGAAALVWSRNPDWSVDQVRDFLVANAIPTSFERDPAEGAGRVRLPPPEAAGCGDQGRSTPWVVAFFLLTIRSLWKGRRPSA